MFLSLFHSLRHVTTPPLQGECGILSLLIPLPSRFCVEVAVGIRTKYSEHPAIQCNDFSLNHHIYF